VNRRADEPKAVRTKPGRAAAAARAARYGRPFGDTARGGEGLGLDTALMGDPRSTVLHRAGRIGFEEPQVSEGDILVADRRLEAADGDLVIALVDGVRVVRRFSESGGRRYLCAGAGPRSVTEITDGARAAVVGVVVSVIPVETPA
jgi:Peptidase S24-like